MDSKNIIGGFGLVMLTLGCGQSKVKGVGIIGNPLDKWTSQYSSDVIRRSQIFFHDKVSNRILKLDIDGFVLTDALSVETAGEEHGLLSNSAGNYVIDFSKKHLQIVRSETDREDRPFKFQGTPVSAAFHDGKGILVMQDDFQSIGLMMLSEMGSVTKSWLGGSLIAEGQNLEAGDLDDNGALILSTTDGSILVIDVEKSIDAGAWQYESFKTDLGTINWIAPDAQFSDYALIATDTKVAVINIKQRQVVTVRDIDKGIDMSKKGKVEHPHILLRSDRGSRAEMLTVGSDGALVSKVLPTSTYNFLVSSFYQRGNATVTAFFEEFGKASVRRMRLSDNLVMADLSFRLKGKAQISGDYTIMNAETPLGHIEQRVLDGDEVKVIDGYNFDYLRGK